MVDLSSCQKSLLEFLLPQVSTRLAEARSAQLHFKPRPPLWLTAAPRTRPPPTRPQCTRLLPTRPTRPTKPTRPTRPRPAPSRSRCTTRRANQWRPPTTRPPLTSPSPHQPALLFQAFPSHSALARSKKNNKKVIALKRLSSQVNSCWSIGQADVDCPNHGLCW